MRRVSFDMSWEELRKEARQIENQIDIKLVAFSKLGSHGDTRGFASSEPLLEESNGNRIFETLALELQQLLIKLSLCNDSMSNILLKDPNPGHVHILSRHRDILNDYTQEFNKAKTNIRTSRERAELLTSVQRDINSYRTSTKSARAQDLYLKENEHINSSNRMADETIGLAVTTKEALLAQRGIIGSISSRVASLGGRFPALNNMMQKVNLRKRRDGLILAGVIATCLILIILYSMR